MPLVCGACNAELFADAKFCPSCGHTTAHAVEARASVIEVPLIGEEPIQSSHRSPAPPHGVFGSGAAPTAPPGGYPPPPGPPGAAFPAPFPLPPHASGRGRIPAALFAALGLLAGAVAVLAVFVATRVGRDSRSTAGPAPTVTSTIASARATSPAEPTAPSASAPPAPAPAPSPSPTTATTARPFTPCGAAAGDVTIGGRVVALSSPVVSTARAPAIILLDGQEGSPVLLERYSQARARLSQSGMIVAEPSGNPVKNAPDGTLLSGWDVSEDPLIGTASSAESRDVVFMTELVRTLIQDRCADPRRIMIGGIAAGAASAIRLACAVDPSTAGFSGFTLVAAFAPVISADMMPNGHLFGCQAGRTFSLVTVVGTADTVAPPPGGGRGGTIGYDQWFGSLAQDVAGCSAPIVRPFSPGASSAPRPEPCSKAKAVLIEVEGLGHAWPGGEPIGFRFQQTPRTRTEFIAEFPHLNPTEFDGTGYLADVFRTTWTP